MEILDIPNKHKKYLGVVINYYRTNNYKEKYSDSWGINEFIKNNNENICSPTTLSNIENGKIVKNNDIYDELLKKLGQKYNYKKDLSNIHKVFEKKFNYAFENFNNELLDDLIEDYIQSLDPYKDFILEKELILALNLSRKTLKPEMENDVGKCLKLFPVYEPAIKLILGEKLHSFAYNYSNLEMLEEIDEIVNLSKSKSYRLQCNYLYNLIKKKYYFEAIELLLKLEKYYLKKDNILGLLKIYSIKLILIEETGSNEWLEESEKTLPIFKKNIAKDKEQIIIYIYNIAIGCFNRKEYNRAFDLLLFVLKKSEKLFLPTAIYLNNISSITGIDVPQEAIREDYDEEKYPEVFNTIYKFYLLKNNTTSPEELEKYIFDNIRPLFVYISDDSLYETFRIELEKCVAITGHKKLIYQYNRIRTRSVKS